MMKINYLLISLILLSCSSNKGDKSDEFKLSCYFFFISDCPASRNNLPKIQALSIKYPSIDFIGVVSDPFLDTVKLNTSLKEFNISIPVILDTNLVIARTHKATITPEVFLYKDKAELIYSGSLDNYFIKLGKHRKIITEHYLENAIEDFTADKKVRTKRTRAVGCFINYSSK